MRQFTMLYLKEIRGLKSSVITLLIIYILGGLAIIMQIESIDRELLILFPLSLLLLPYYLETSYRAERTQFTYHLLLSRPVRRHLIILSKHSAILSLYIVFFVIAYWLENLAMQMSFQQDDILFLFMATYSFLLICMSTFIEPFRSVFKKHQKFFCGSIAVVCLIVYNLLYSILSIHFETQILRYALYTVIFGSLLTIAGAIFFNRFGEL